MVAGLSATVGAAWFVQHVRELRDDRIRTGTPVARVQVVSTDTAVAGAMILVLLAVLATSVAGSAAWRRRRMAGVALFVAAVDGSVIEVTRDGELSRSRWIRPLDRPARARAVAVLGHHLARPRLPLVVPVSRHAATLIHRNAGVSTERDPIIYAVIGRVLG